MEKQTKKRRGRKKKINLPELDFLESPIEGFSTVDHPDFGQPIEFSTTANGQTQWISPHIKSTFFTPKQKRSAMARVGTKNKKMTNKVILKENYNEIDNDDTTIVDEHDIETPKRVTRSMTSKSICMTPNGNNNKSTENIDEVDSPMLPSNLSTPDMVGPSASETRLSASTKRRKSSTHFLFQAQTPTTKDFVVLAKNTPLP